MEPLPRCERAHLAVLGRDGSGKLASRALGADRVEDLLLVRHAAKHVDGAGQHNVLQVGAVLSPEASKRWKRSSENGTTSHPSSFHYLALAEVRVLGVHELERVHALGQVEAQVLPRELLADHRELCRWKI